MSLQKRLTKHGNSYALIIDRALIDLLEFDVNAPLELSTPDGKALTIRQPAELRRKGQLEQATDDLYSRHDR